MKARTRLPAVDRPVKTGIGGPVTADRSQVVDPGELFIPASAGRILSPAEVRRIIASREAP